MLKKRICAILLMLTMVVTFLPTMAFADTITTNQASILLQAKSVGKNKVKLSWNSVADASKYVVYANKCGKTIKAVKTLGTNKTSYTLSKISKKKLTAHKSYKFYVRAYNGKTKLCQSKTLHFIVGNTMDKCANVTKVTAEESLKLEVGKTAKVNAEYKVYKNKKHIKTNHGSKIRYMSDSTAVAIVNSNGLVKAVGEGTATIYSQDIGGKYATTNVSVTANVDPVPTPTPVNPIIPWPWPTPTPEKTSYTVTFDMNGHGNQIEPITEITEGKTILQPETPVVEGYGLEGWYMTKDDSTGALSNKWDFSKDVVTSDVVLYANWIDMPVKGGIVYLDNDKYRVIKVDNCQAEVVAMSGQEKEFDSSEITDTVSFYGEQIEVLKYKESSTDSYLNGNTEGCYYYNLSDNIKKAIVPQTIYQYAYYRMDTPPTGNYWSGTYDFGGPEPYYLQYDENAKLLVGERYVYALDVKDVIEYLGTDGINSKKLNQMFFDSEELTSDTCWLRSASIDLSKYPRPHFNYSFYVDGSTGEMIYNPFSNPAEVRASFTLDLSKCDWSETNNENYGELTTKEMADAVELLSAGGNTFKSYLGDLYSSDDATVNACYVATNGAGIVAEVSSMGFGGPVVILVGVDNTGVTTAIKAISYDCEISGKLACEDSTYLANYAGKSIVDKISDIDSYSSASITSTAIKNSVLGALEQYKALNSKK